MRLQKKKKKNEKEKKKHGLRNSFTKSSSGKKLNKETRERRIATTAKTLKPTGILTALMLHLYDFCDDVP